LHKSNHNKQAANINEKERMKEFLDRFLQTHNTIRGLNIEQSIHMFRLQTVKSFLQAGRPLSQIDDQREYLEEFAKLPLTHSSQLKVYVQIIRDLEIADIRELLKKCRHVLAIYDGTTRVDNVFCVVFRFVMEDFTIVQN
jgi:hypothetical protein